MISLKRALPTAELTPALVRWITGVTEAVVRAIGAQPPAHENDHGRDSEPARRRRYWIRTMSGIVILEEDDLMRGLLEEWLTEAGYAVRRSGLDDAPAASGAGLVIIDLHSPREAGLETVRAARKAYPGAPVIAISGRFRSGLAGACAAAQALGAHAVIAKPFSRDDLLAAVRAVIGVPA